MNPAVAAADHFVLGGPPESARPLPGGHIHSSWRVQAGGRGWVLQRMNTAVFADPDAVMGNLRVLAARVSNVVAPVRTVEGGVLWRGDSGVWRAFPFLEGTSAPRPPYTPVLARRLGMAFGSFHRDTADLDPALLVEVLPNFHDVARRLAQLGEVVAADPVGRVAGCAAELATIERRGWTGALAGPWIAPAVPVRVAHFDAKADNVLLDDVTGLVRAVVDLDTAMPGSWLWDVGDLVRSAGCTVAEDARDPSSARLDLAVFGALLDGYRSVVAPLLTRVEERGLVAAPLVATFEQAVRFLADHLAGDTYYRVAREGHNLERARVQLALLGSMIDCRSAMIAAL